MNEGDMTKEKKSIRAGNVHYSPVVEEIITAQGDREGQRCEEPFAVVVMGATGDLTARKLMPALYRLYLNGALPDCFTVIGCGRTDLSDDGFRSRMKGALSEFFEGNKTEKFESLSGFLSRLYYHRIAGKGEGEEKRDYENLAKLLERQRQKNDTAGNKLFYLALPPSRYGPTVQRLGEAGLGVEDNEGAQWSRLIVEKPFGHDLESAMTLDKQIHDYFGEHQIYRIDHYLAKETVQNILMFRFANSIFEPIWNRQFIEKVQVRALESVGVHYRAQYYEQSGVIRDMFQNHMMQLLAMIGMEPPSIFDSEQVRDEKVKLYRALRPFPTDRLDENLVLGQYTEGELMGEMVRAYRREEGVSPTSDTPTYAKMRVFLDNWRWQGVPFYIESGKRLAEKLTDIIIDFKTVPHSMFKNFIGEEIQGNRLVLSIYPAEGITLTFKVKKPGIGIALRTVNMDLDYYTGDEVPRLNAYERVLLDCMIGDQTLFWRQDGVEACWSFLSPIISRCEECDARKKLLFFYPAGSLGPEWSHAVS